MTKALLASAVSFASSPTELILLIVTIIVLSVRAWMGIVGEGHSKRGNRPLTIVSLVLIAAFAILVIFRFKTLG